MRMNEPILSELDREAATTRRLLERVPDARLGFKPHEKSMSLGQLAWHVATTPGAIADLAQKSGHELNGFSQPLPESTAAVLEAFDEGMVSARKKIAAMDDADLSSTWKATSRGREVLSVPKIGLIRSIMLNHWYHHRGQLSVYLRLLDVPLPSIYGPSADENPFA
ncbi:MAG TPA: DinB family protein [Thermoanaerobaculia bacterium]|nr:DinB family protein [Thermoanaerobaculia bacterium]